LTQNIELDLADYVVAEIAVVDGAGAVVHCNRKWEETAKTGGLLPKQLGWNYIAECEAAIQRGCDVAEILAGLRAVLQGELPSFVATYACPFNGLYHWFQVLISVVEIKGTRHAILMHVDVSAMQRDALTGLPNRAMFDAQLHLALSLAQESSSRTGIIIVDMNNLKFLNDKHGHHTGDEALKGLAQELKNKVGPDCVATRIGGDEFGVVLPVNYDTLFARRVRAISNRGSLAQSDLCNIQYLYQPVSDSRFIRTTARLPAIFSDQPTNRCTRTSAARRSLSPAYSATVFWIQCLMSVVGPGV